MTDVIPAIEGDPVVAPEDNEIKIYHAPLLDAIFDWQSFCSSANLHKGESVLEICCWGK